MNQDQTISILEEISHIRLRPTMYVGSIQTPKNLIREILDNAFDECLNGWCTKVEINTGNDDKGYYYEVKDYGRGLPLYQISKEDLKSETSEIAAKLLFTKLFSGGKFNKDNYLISSGTHGIGLTVVNALSKFVIVETCDLNSTYHLELESGTPVSEIIRTNTSNYPRYTKIRMYPDPTIFNSVNIQIDINDLQVVKSQLKDVEITLNGFIITPLLYKEIFPEKMILTENINFEYYPTINELTSWKKGLKLRLQLNWSDSEFDLKNFSTINLIISNGFHTRSSTKLIGESLNSINKEFSIKDYQLGLRFIVDVLVPDPEFSSQSKETLSSSKSLQDSLPDILSNLCKVLKNIDLELLFTKIRLYKSTIEKLSISEYVKSRVKKGVGENPLKNLGNIVYECTSKSRKDTELILTEGRSAGGNLIATRDKSTQAILPLKGKILNVLAANDIKRSLSNKEVHNIINTIGIGIFPNEDLSCRRYDRIIILSDGDSDGYNISALVVGSLSCLVPSLLLEGYVYIIKAPLYKQNGKYLIDDKTLDKKKSFKRYKGLGEMNPDELYEIALNHNTRELIMLELLTSDREEVNHLIGTSLGKQKLLKSRNLV